MMIWHISGWKKTYIIRLNINLCILDSMMHLWKSVMRERWRNKLGMVVHAFNSNNLEAEAGGSNVKVSLCYELRNFLQNKVKWERSLAFFWLHVDYDTRVLDVRLHWRWNPTRWIHGEHFLLLVSVLYHLSSANTLSALTIFFIPL